jgi:hypothetical protein
VSVTQSPRYRTNSRSPLLSPVSHRRLPPPTKVYLLRYAIISLNFRFLRVICFYRNHCSSFATIAVSLLCAHPLFKRYELYCLIPKLSYTHHSPLHTFFLCFCLFSFKSFFFYFNLYFKASQYLIEYMQMARDFEDELLLKYVVHHALTFIAYTLTLWQ